MFRATAALGAVILSLAAGCRTPTQVTVDVRLDFDCTDRKTTTIRVGALGAGLSGKPVVDTDRCAGRRIGSIVVVPSGDKSAELAIEVVVGIDKTALQCALDGFKGGCIVARRALRYVAHDELELPIDMRLDCRDVPCNATQTCLHGACVDALIEDSTQCHGNGCDDRSLKPGTPVDSGVDAGVDSGDAIADVGLDTAVDASDAAESGDSDAGAGPVAQIVAGENFTCVRKTDSSVWCWGDNSVGQIGDGTTAATRPSPTPVLVSAGGKALTGVVEIAAAPSGKSACALKNDDTVVCWGNDEEGQVGDSAGAIGAFRRSPTPVVMSLGGAPLTGAKHIAVGARNACAIMKPDDSLLCWGDNGPTSVEPQPPPGGPVTGIAQISLGGAHTCALKIGGTALCWGYNVSGQVGDGTFVTPRDNPTQVLLSLGGPALANIAQISAGWLWTCARLKDGTAMCWGDNGNGDLGDGTITNRPSPTPVRVFTDGPALGSLLSISAGDDHSCVRQAGNTAFCWGRNGDGECGDGTKDDTRINPTQVLLSPGGPVFSGVIEIVAGGSHTCALKLDGQIACWGANGSGQVGDATTITPLPSPTRVVLP